MVKDTSKNKTTWNNTIKTPSNNNVKTLKNVPNKASKKEILKIIENNNQNKEKHNKRRNMIYIIIFGILLLAIIIAASYAYFLIGTANVNNLGNISATIECLNISIDEDHPISLENQYPISDEYALANLIPVTISVTNNCSTNLNDINYTLTLTSLSDATGYISDSKIRTYITRNLNNAGLETLKSANYLNTLNVVSSGNIYNSVSSSLNVNNDTKDYANKTIYRIDSRLIGNGETNVYNIYLWVDYYEGDSGVYNGEAHDTTYDNTTMGLEFKASINTIVNVADYVTVNYHSNNGNDTVITEQEMSNSITLSQNTFTKDGYVFAEWNTEPDGSGTSYNNGEVINNMLVQQLDLYAQWADGIVGIGKTYYPTLADAISHVPANGTATIKLYGDISEGVIIPAGKNITFDLQNFTISNSGDVSIIKNNGTVRIFNGTLTSNATSKSAIDNESTGTIYISGGRIIATGLRQTLYNNGGIAEISGDAYLISSITATDKVRGTVHNLANGTMTIKGGTIISTTEQAGVYNEATLTIGESGGTVSTTIPMIQGDVYGIRSTTSFSLYDGIMKGKTAGINDDANVTAKETGYNIVHGTETIGSYTYNTTYLTNNTVCTVTFNPNLGTVDESSRTVECGSVIENLPTPSRTDYRFVGWYTDAENGTLIDNNTVIQNSIPVYAHWVYGIIESNGQNYNTMQSAIDAATSNTNTTIELYDNITETFTIGTGKIITLVLNGNTISNSTNTAIITNSGTLNISDGTISMLSASTTQPVVENNGIFRMTGGKLTTAATAGAVNNNSGAQFYMSGGRIEATGKRQAIYNAGGSVEISGTAYLSSSITDTNKDRATIHNLANGTVTIKGGTVVSTTTQPAIYNLGSLTIGIKDENVSTTNPVIQGETYGIKSTVNFTLHDGIIKGKTAGINDETKVTIQETGYTITHGTDSGYNTAYLQQ